MRIDLSVDRFFFALILRYNIYVLVWLIDGKNYKSGSDAALPLRQQRILAVGTLLSQFKFGIVLKAAFL